MGTEAATAKNARRRRAKWESFEYRVPIPDRVRIENVSYGDESVDHVYIVVIEDGEAISCTCPSDEHHPGRCKHRIAVENHPAVLVAANTEAKDRRTTVPATRQGGQ